MFNLLKWYFKMLFKVIRLLFGRKLKPQRKFNGEVITDEEFVVLSEEFAKDSKTAYYKSRAFEYADVTTFEAVDKHYAKDKDKVYYCDQYREGQNYYLTKRQTIKEVENCDPATFESLKYGFAKDKRLAWFQGMPFEVKDVASLLAIDNHFAKDDVAAYLNLRPIAESNGKTFELIDRNFAKDKFNIYYYGYTGEAQHNIIKLPCNRQTFNVLDDRYSKDDANVFFLGFTMKEADGASFEILSGDYSRDKNKVFFRERKITGANPGTFYVYTENGMYGHDFSYAQDALHVFMDDKMVQNADVATFKVLGGNYGVDDKYVFYKTNIVKNALPRSFKVYPHDVGNADAEDVNNKYHEGKKVV